MASESEGASTPRPPAEDTGLLTPEQLAQVDAWIRTKWPNGFCPVLMSPRDARRHLRGLRSYRESRSVLREAAWTCIGVAVGALTGWIGSSNDRQGIILAVLTVAFFVLGLVFAVADRLNRSEKADALALLIQDIEESVSGGSGGQ